jgi:hypothetical protein
VVLEYKHWNGQAQAIELVKTELDGIPTAVPSTDEKEIQVTIKLLRNNLVRRSGSE